MGWVESLSVYKVVRWLTLYQAGIVVCLPNQTVHFLRLFS